MISSAKKEEKTSVKEEKKPAVEKASQEKKTEETVDYNKMTVAELKEEAKKKNISVAGLKKADIIAALEK